LAIRAGAVYVADTRAVWRLPYRVGEKQAGGPAERVTPPGALGSGGSHWTRNIVFAPDGAHFFVAIGSAGNLAEEPAPRATVQAFAADGSNQRTFADGLRNPVGIAVRPGSDELWVVVNERDGLGDELVPDYLTRIRRGDFFGWPYAYTGTNPQPGFADRRPDLVRRSRVPDLLFRSHSAPIGLVFYTGTSFPPAYRGDAFVALRGSWNADRPRGYMVARVPFEDGRPRGYYEAFATGFWVAGTTTAQVIGRPAGLAVTGDGALLIADDTGDRVWQVRYVGD
jgi:glucose/arabinose dehydrogenase